MCSRYSPAVSDTTTVCRTGWGCTSSRVHTGRAAVLSPLVCRPAGRTSCLCWPAGLHEIIERARAAPHGFHVLPVLPRSVRHHHSVPRRCLESHADDRTATANFRFSKAFPPCQILASAPPPLAPAGLVSLFHPRNTACFVLRLIPGFVHIAAAHEAQTSPLLSGIGNWYVCFNLGAPHVLPRG